MTVRQRWSAICAALMACVAAACEGPPLLILPTTLPNGIEAAAYSTSLMSDADGGANFTLIAGRLPTGLQLSSSTGMLTGTPIETGSFAFAIEARQGGFTVRVGTRDFALTIIPELQLAGSLPAARQAEEYDEMLTATGGVAPYTFQVIGLPGGIGFNNDTGMFSGTPTQPDDGRVIRATVSDSGAPMQTVTRDLFFEVKPLAVSITTNDLPNGITGIPYSAEVVAEDGLQPYSFSIVEGVLPNGLSLPNNRRTGVISGTPSVAGTFNFTIEVTDSDSPPTTASREFSVTIN